MKVIYLSEETQQAWLKLFPTYGKNSMYKILEENEVAPIPMESMYSGEVRVVFPLFMDYHLKLTEPYRELMGVKTLPLKPDDEGVIYRAIENFNE